MAATVAAVCTFRLIASWNRLTIRRMLIATAAASIAIAVYESHWYWTIGYPTMSPFLAQFTLVQPSYVNAAGLSVVAATCFLFVMRFVPEANDEPAIIIKTPRAYHLSDAVMGLLLAAMVANGMPAWWDTDATIPLLGFGFPGPFSELKDWWDSGAGLLDLPRTLLQIVNGIVSYWLDEPKMLLRMAAVLVVASRLRRGRRGELAAELVRRVRVRKLMTVAVFATATLLVAIPAGAWLGFAIVTTTIAGR
jgi:hypothetical protein